jgi:hypothetical protein
MWGLGKVLDSLGQLLGERQENLYIAAAIVLVLAGPLADRYFLRRKRIHYRVLYNSKIGLSPVDLHDGDQPSDRTNPHLVQYAHMLERMSVVIIRIRNTGGYDIEPDDFVTPLSFSFGARIIWDARISEATTDDLRRTVREHLEFFSTAAATSTHGQENLGTVRERLARRVATWLDGAPPVPRAEPESQLHGVRLAKLPLNRNEKFKLVLVLREPDDYGPELTKNVERDGHLGSGRIQDEKNQRRITWPARPWRWERCSPGRSSRACSPARTGPPIAPSHAHRERWRSPDRARSRRYSVASPPSTTAAALARTSASTRAAASTASASSPACPTRTRTPSLCSRTENHSPRRG